MSQITVGYTNVVAACWHSIVQNAHALLDVFRQRALIPNVQPLMLV